MAKKKTSKKTSSKTAKKKPQTTKKAATKSSKKTAKKKTVKKKASKVEKPQVAEKPVDNDLDNDVDDEVIEPIKLEGDNLKKEIKELENVENGKKNLTSKKPGRGGTRRVKPKHVVTARKPTGGLKLAPGVMLTGKKKTDVEEKPAKKEEPKEYRRLTEKELKDTRVRLIELRERILENMRKEIADYRHRASSSSADPIDQAADAYDDDVTFEIAANNDEELEQIEAALEKIEKGTYGLCEMCSVTISPSRLRILPFATRCVNCRENYEKTKTKKEVSSSWAFLEGDDSDSDS